MKIRALQQAIREIGYTAVEEGYVFSDVFSSTGQNRQVALAAFTHEPPSYRNAALAVVESGGREAAEVAKEYRALGAPLLFVIEDERVTVCGVHPQQRPTIYREASWSQIETLFNEHRELWKPQRIHNAKSFGFLDREYQLDFVDAGLLPAIEGEIHGKLDRLLNETLAETVRMRVIRPGERVDDLFIFRTVFRLLAAKVLQDRGHEVAQSWNPDDIDTVLGRISGFYRLSPLPGEGGSLKGTVFESAWNHLRDAINFRNISSDDLAFVYENTLVTDETRKHFGVHSTPRAVAEYVVGRIQISESNVSSTRVYEPFAGAGVFMVAALRRLRDLLPITMGALERHKFLVDRIRGDEIEPFAKEVATLSLILADYPNENGWAVSAIDLFENDTLEKRAQGSSIILCNPPFEKFTEAERAQYPEATNRSPRKPIAVIDAVLRARSNALGFVLPETFISGPHYKRQREQIERLYKDIELVWLPDRVFKASIIRSSLLIAQQPRAADDISTILRSTSVRVRDREQFLKTSQVSETRVKQRPVESGGSLWLNELDELWEYLGELPKLGTVANVHRGIEWSDKQFQATRLDPARGFCPGIHSGDAIGAFVHSKPIYLDCRPSRLRRGARHPWDAPKVLANAARLSRGPWCFAAAIDRRKLVASQQLFGIWPSKMGLSLEAIVALLNNPLVIAYIACHSPPDRIRAATVESVPIPKELPSDLDALVRTYLVTLGERKQLFSIGFDERANSALHEIDAALLRAYDLPPRLERRLLEYFRGETRPTAHAWQHWLPEGFQPFIPLHEYLSPEFKKATRPWLPEVFSPLPEEEAEAISDYMD